VQRLELRQHHSLPPALLALLPEQLRVLPPLQRFQTLTAGPLSYFLLIMRMLLIGRHQRLSLEELDWQQHLRHLGVGLGVEFPTLTSAPAPLAALPVKVEVAALRTSFFFLRFFFGSNSGSIPTDEAKGTTVEVALPLSLLPLSLL